jgi:hypothetical protein
MDSQVHVPTRSTAASWYVDVGPTTVRELLHEMGLASRGTAKRKEAAQHVDSDAQFHPINDTAAACWADGSRSSASTRRRES